jgi:serine protease Do
MKVLNWGVLAGAVALAAVISPVAEVQAQNTILRAVEAGRGARIGASVTTDDNKELTTGVILETVEPGGPADKAGIKAGDLVSEFDGERVRSVRQFLRLVQETTPGRSVPVVLSRGGQRVTVNVTPERASDVRMFGDDFSMRYLDVPRAFPPTPPSPPSPPAPGRAPRPPAVFATPAPFEFLGRLFNTRRLGITIEDLDTQLAEYFGVKEGVLVKSVAADSAGAKAGLKAGDVITGVNGRKVYDSSDVTRALERGEDDAEFTIEITRDKKPQTLKGKLEARDNRSRTRVRTIV